MTKSSIILLSKASRCENNNENLKGYFNGTPCLGYEMIYTVVLQDWNNIEHFTFHFSCCLFVFALYRQKFHICCIFIA